MQPLLSRASGFLLFALASCSSPVLEPIVKNGNSTWCATHTTNIKTYCRDFDDGEGYNKGWSSTYEKDNGLAHAFVDCADHALDSPSCSLLVITSQVPSGDSAQLQLTRLFESGSGVELGFANKIIDYDVGSPNVGLIAVYLQDAEDWALGIDFVDGQIQLTERHDMGDASPSVFNKTMAGPFTAGIWHQYGLKITVNTYPQLATLTYDGSVVADNVPITPPSYPVRLKTLWGANFVEGPAKPMTLSYDNITIDAL